MNEMNIDKVMIEQMRGWIADCDWADLDFDASELTEAEILNGIRRHYAGGIPQFLRDASPLLVK